MTTVSTATVSPSNGPVIPSNEPVSLSNRSVILSGVLRRTLAQDAVEGPRERPFALHPQHLSATIPSSQSSSITRDSYQ
jgi:hypothetical protein